MGNGLKRVGGVQRKYQPASTLPPQRTTRVATDIELADEFSKKDSDYVSMVEQLNARVHVDVETEMPKNVEPTWEEKVKMAKMVDPDYEFREQLKKQMGTSGQFSPHLQKHKTVGTSFVVPGKVGLEVLSNILGVQNNPMYTPEQAEMMAEQLAMQHGVNLQLLRQVTKHFSVPVHGTSKKLLGDIPVAYDPKGPVPQFLDKTL